MGCVIVRVVRVRDDNVWLKCMRDFVNTNSFFCECYSLLHKQICTRYAVDLIISGMV